jgi:hypothetical protein
MTATPSPYVQAYRPRAWPQPHLSHLPAGAVAIDAFFGVPEMIGRGHGRAFLRVFTGMRIAEAAPAVAIDPDADNHRARRAYAHAGFVGGDVAETDDRPVVVTVFRPQSDATICLLD